MSEDRMAPLLREQHWTFVSPERSRGLLVEVAYPYRPVQGRREPGYAPATG
jgi:hypothetical protein